MLYYFFRKIPGYCIDPPVPLGGLVISPEVPGGGPELFWICLLAHCPVQVKLFSAVFIFRTYKTKMLYNDTYSSYVFQYYDECMSVPKNK